MITFKFRGVTLICRRDTGEIFDPSAPPEDATPDEKYQYMKNSPLWSDLVHDLEMMMAQNILNATNPQPENR